MCQQLTIGTGNERAGECLETAAGFFGRPGKRQPVRIPLEYQVYGQFAIVKSTTAARVLSMY